MTKMTEYLRLASCYVPPDYPMSHVYGVSGYVMGASDQKVSNYNCEHCNKYINIKILEEKLNELDKPHSFIQTAFDHKLCLKCLSRDLSKMLLDLDDEIDPRVKSLIKTLEDP